MPTFEELLESWDGEQAVIHRDRESGGAGLGLAIVREVVVAHGGKVWVADSVVGAEFHVRLPRGTRRGPE